MRNHKHCAMWITTYEMECIAKLAQQFDLFLNMTKLVCELASLLKLDHGKRMAVRPLPGIVVDVRHGCQQIVI